MADKSTVASDLRRFATFVQGLTAAADTLDQMQSLEETALATEQRVATAQSLLNEKAADLASAEKQLAEIREKASKSVKDARQRAQAKYDALVDEASQKASKIVTDAQAQAAITLESTIAEHGRLTEQIGSMGDQLIRMTDDQAALAAAIESGTATLAELEGKLAAAREAVAKMLG